MCSNTCSTALDGHCDEVEGMCPQGTDCSDCGLEGIPLCPYVGPCWNAQVADASPALFASWTISIVVAVVAVLASGVDAFRAHVCLSEGPLMPLSHKAIRLSQRSRCLRRLAMLFFLASFVAFIVWYVLLLPSIAAFHDKAMTQSQIASSPTDDSASVGSLPKWPKAMNNVTGTTQALEKASHSGLHPMHDAQIALVTAIVMLAALILIAYAKWRCCRRRGWQQGLNTPPPPNLMDVELQSLIDVEPHAQGMEDSGSTRFRNVGLPDLFNLDVMLEPGTFSTASPQPEPYPDLTLPVVGTSSTHLNMITAFFSVDQIVGRGAFGTVYKSISIDLIEPSARHQMPAFCMRPCAVKRLVAGADPCSLMNELQVLASCRHENILPVLAFCFEPGCKALVMPFMPGGTLNDRLFPSNLDADDDLAEPRWVDASLVEAVEEVSAAPLSAGPRLEWQECLRILRDVARALSYLHKATPHKPQIFHRDVKPSNILLDCVLNAKLSDLGVAKARLGGDTLATNTTVGSPGYIDPLYVNGGRVSEVTDGYALGVTILVCMTRQKAIVRAAHGDDCPLTEACSELLANPSGSSEAIYERAGVWWPASIAIEAAQLAAGLTCPRRRDDRTRVEDVKLSLEALAIASEMPAGIVDTEAPAGIVGTAAFDLPAGIVDNTARLCMVCMDANRSVRFSPCGHSTCCDECAALIMGRGDPCPNCRGPIDGVNSRGPHVATEDTFVVSF